MNLKDTFLQEVMTGGLQTAFGAGSARVAFRVDEAGVSSIPGLGVTAQISTPSVTTGTAPVI